MKTINIGEKDRPVHFGINALAEFNLATGTCFAFFFNIQGNPLSMNFDHVRWLAFVGLKHGSIEAGQQVDFNVDMVGKWLDKDFDKFPEIIAAVKESMPEMDKKKV